MKCRKCVTHERAQPLRLRARVGKRDLAGFQLPAPPPLPAVLFLFHCTQGPEVTI